MSKEPTKNHTAIVNTLLSSVEFGLFHNLLIALLSAVITQPLSAVINYALDNNLMTKVQIDESLKGFYSPDYIKKKFIVPVRRARRASY